MGRKQTDRTAKPHDWLGTSYQLQTAQLQRVLAHRRRHSQRLVLRPIAFEGSGVLDCAAMGRLRGYRIVLVRAGSSYPAFRRSF